MPSHGWKGSVDGDDVVSRRRRRWHGRLLKEETLEIIPVIDGPCSICVRVGTLCNGRRNNSGAQHSKERRWLWRKRPCARSRATEDAGEDAEDDGVDDGGDDGVDGDARA